MIPDCAKDTTCVVNPAQRDLRQTASTTTRTGWWTAAIPSCKSFPACLRAACTPDVDFGAIASSGASVTRTMSTVGATASYGTCAPPGGVGRVGSFSLAASADVKLDFSQGSSSAHVVAVFRAGVGQACDQNRVDCLRVGQDATATHTFNGLAAGNYWIVVQSFTGTEGIDHHHPVDQPGPLQPRSATTGSTTTAMALSTARIWTVPAPPTAGRASLTSTSAPSWWVTRPRLRWWTPPRAAIRYHPSCAGASTGKDIVVRFTIKDTVGLLLKMTQPTGDSRLRAIPDAKGGGGL